MRVTAVGDCGVDRYVNRGYDRPGGITLNFAANARRLFAPDDAVGVVSAVGTDPEARLVRRAVEVLGLEAFLAEREGATSIQYIDQQPSGEKIFVRYEEGVLRDYRVGAEELAVIARSDLLMAVVYAQVEGFFDSVMAAPSAGLRAVDFSDLAGVTGGVSIADRYAGRFHVGFFGLGPGDGAIIDHLDGLARRSGRVIVVTLGADGSLALGGPARLAQPALAVPRIVDTTGAGDAFAAGFLREYSATGRIGASLEAGARSGAEAVQRLGAFPWVGDPDHLG
jgi:sugar/nucleoside kinase (ribokinase family)